MIVDEQQNTSIFNEHFASNNTVTRTVEVDLPNPAAAQKRQDELLGMPSGKYDAMTNSCASHVGDILRAGGRADATTKTTDVIRWLKKNGRGQKKMGMILCEKHGATIIALVSDELFQSIFEGKE